MEDNTQELYLQLIANIKVNAFNGTQVAEDLRNNRELWEAIIPTGRRDRDMVFLEKQYWIPKPGAEKEEIPRVPPYDSIVIRPRDQKTQKKLTSLAKNWNPSSTEWICHRWKGGQEKKVAFRYLHLWWD